MIVRKNKDLVVLLLVLVISCQETYTPKPKGYLRIDFPEKEYTDYNESCPFIFEYPVYGNIEPDKDNPEEHCWMNITFPEYNGKIYFTYKKVNNNLAKYLEDSRTLAYKHTIKAEAIEETLLTFKDRNVYGVLYDIKGNAASSIQFHVTDSLYHFLRGSLYFNVEPNKDSLAPVIKFFREDIVHIINTFEWK